MTGLLEAASAALGALAGVVVLAAAGAAVIIGLADKKTWQQWKRLPLKPRGDWWDLLLLPAWISSLFVVASVRGTVAMAVKFTKRTRKEGQP